VRRSHDRRTFFFKTQFPTSTVIQLVRVSERAHLGKLTFAADEPGVIRCHPAPEKDRRISLAIYHFSAKTIGRSAGQSAVAAAAYRSAERLTDRATGEVKFYPARAGRVVFEGLFAPKGAPAWARNREALWNQVESVENRRNSTFAREYEISLPAELSHVQQIWLVQDFVKSAFVRRGLVADVCIHMPDRGADDRNVHSHIMVAERQIDQNGFAKKKDRSLQKRELLHLLRKQWADLANQHLELHGYTARIDHRILAAQGIDRQPTTHLGYVAKEMERSGRKSRRGDRLRNVQANNALLDAQGTMHDKSDRKRIAEADRRTRRAAQPTLRSRGPGDDDGQRASGAGGSYYVSNRSNRVAPSRRSKPHERNYGARLRLAFLRLLPLIRVRHTVEQFTELPRSVDYIPRKDLWGIPELPPTP
jgi:hypothetical protein